MKLIDADELRDRLLNDEREPTPYDAEFCAMINELAAETEVENKTSLLNSGKIIVNGREINRISVLHIEPQNCYVIYGEKNKVLFFTDDEAVF